MTVTTDGARTRWLAMGLGALAGMQVLAAAGLSLHVGWSLAVALEAFVVTNSVMGTAFATCGALIAHHRPRNAIGWLFLAAGLGHATTAVGAPLIQVLHDAGASLAVQRLAATVTAYAWPWSIGLFLPLALLLFPDGRALSRRWRPVILAVIVTAPLFVLAEGASPQPYLADVPVVGYLTIASHADLQPVWTLSDLRYLAVVTLAIVLLTLRYRRGGEVQRRQLLWLVLATITMLLFTLPWSLVAGTPVVVLFAIPLIPIAVTVAIIRHQLLDIRLVVSQAMAWLLLSGAAVVVYVVLVAVLDRFVTAQFGRSAAATVIVAVLVAPLLPRLQRQVDRAMYGDRRDPSMVASRVGEQLTAGPDRGLTEVVVAVREALRLSYVALLTDHGVIASAGERPPGPIGSVTLEYAGGTVGELRVGLRPGERDLSTADQRVLGLVAAPLAIALHATRLSDELQRSRERLVTAQEEERRRLRRDLHDGLGPALTGMALTADAAANLTESDGARSRELLATLRTDTRTAIADIRRIVEDLRPPALDELGLLGALAQRAEQVRWRADGDTIHVRIDLPDELPALPAAVEVAAYRIATEALNNVVRHSQATTAVLRVRCGDTLEVTISDNGSPNGSWRPGVGLQTMRERTDQLGGWLEAGGSATGGRVAVWLPLASR